MSKLLPILNIPESEIILPSDKGVMISAAPHPFRASNEIFFVQEGDTIGEIFERVQPDSVLRKYAHIFVGDVYIPKAYWGKVRPKNGATVSIRVVPMGGGGGGKKNPLRTILTIAVIAASWWASAAWGPAMAQSMFGPGFAGMSFGGISAARIGGAIVGGMVSMAGNLLINAIAPPPMPKMRSMTTGRISSERDSPTLFIQGARNQFHPFGVIPRVLGKHLMVPPYGARPFTETVGDDQYVRMIFCYGYGPITIEDRRIGETTISAFEEVEREFRRGFKTSQITDQGNWAAGVQKTFSTGDVNTATDVITVTSHGYNDDDEVFFLSSEVPEDLPAPLVEGKPYYASSTTTHTLKLVTAVEDPVLTEIDLSDVGTGTHTITKSDSVSYPSSPDFGDKYTVTTPGRVDGVDYITGDVIIFNDTAADSSSDSWDKNGDQPLKLYTDDVYEESLSILLTQASGWSLRTTQASTDDISIDITFYRGLVQFSGAGSKGDQTVELEIESSLTGVGDWKKHEVTYDDDGEEISYSVTARQTNAVRRSIHWRVDTQGQYDVRIRRTTADTEDTKIFDEMTWSALRSITDQDPINMSGIALEAVRIKATDQLRGVVDQWNAIVQSIILDWTGSAWVLAPTSNPASCYREVLQGSANGKPVADSRMDLSNLQDWHDYCATNGFEFNMVRDFVSTVHETLMDIAAVGRSAKSVIDGKWGVITDQVQSTSVQHFTPRNSWGYEGTRNYYDLPHAFRVRFINRDKRWREDSRIVYDDGYDSDSATEFEELELSGITDSDHVWKDGRYHIASIRLRPDEHKFSTDFEYIIATRGQKILFTHDVINIGIAAGRIKSVAVDGGDATDITVDEALDMELGKNYGVSIRTDDDNELTEQIITNAGSQTTVTFTTPIPAANIPTAGDLFGFGELGSETIDLVIKSINPLGDFAAQLTCVDYNSALYTADSGTIPPWTSNVTIPVEISYPAVTDIVSDESAMALFPGGLLILRVQVIFGFFERRPTEVTSIEARFRPSGSEGAWLNTIANGQAPEIFLEPVEEGEVLEFQVRARTGTGDGPWGPLLIHTVIGGSTPPDEVDSVYIESGSLHWVFADPPRDFDGYILKTRGGFSVNWSDAMQVHDDIYREQSFEINKLPSGPRTFMVATIDKFGNESTSKPFVFLTVPDASTNNILETFDFKALGFPGTLTDCTIVSGDLKADSHGDLYLPIDSALYLSDGAALYLPITYKDMTYQSSLVPNYWPSEISFEITIAGNSWTMEYRTQGDSIYLPAGANIYLPIGTDPFLESPSSWRVMPVKFSAARQKYDIRISISGGSTRGVISEDIATMDVEDIVERFTDVVLSSGGSRLPITKTYRSIVYVEDIVLQSAANVASIQVVDMNATLGPLVKLLDFSGSDIGGTLNNAAVRGY
ncbi:hypothetical protein LCGC14_0231930 [marine sediment metagenome]|uniref:Tip attachment protein J HDII-ins2 domain-containing protein n=1 Tax=marine sediment metagenome TaxID=412755 RepID=A0A0F9UA61_9ZZZZ